MANWLKEETFLSGVNLAGFSHTRQCLGLVALVDVLKSARIAPLDLIRSCFQISGFQTLVSESPGEPGEPTKTLVQEPHFENHCSRSISSSMGSQQTGVQGDGVSLSKVKQLETASPAPDLSALAQYHGTVHHWYSIL